MIKYIDYDIFIIIIVNHKFIIIDFETQDIIDKEYVIKLINEKNEKELININSFFNINLDNIFINNKNELGIFGNTDEIINFFNILIKQLSKKNQSISIEMYWIENSKNMFKLIIEVLIKLFDNGLLYKENMQIRNLNFSLLLEYLDIKKFKELNEIINNNQEIVGKLEKHLIYESNFLISSNNIPLSLNINYFMLNLVQDFINFMIKNFQEVDLVNITEEEKKEIINYFNF